MIDPPQVAVLTCMDARLHPNLYLGLDLGEISSHFHDAHVIRNNQPTTNRQPLPPPPGDAHVIRNAGGRASDDALRSLTLSQRLLGTTEIHVIHHTDCGMLTFSNEEVSRRRQDGT